MHKLTGVLLGWGPQGLLLLGFLDSAGIPIVGGVDALLLAIAAEEPEKAYWAACLAALGSLAGSLLLFWIARKGGEVLLMRRTVCLRVAWRNAGLCLYWAVLPCRAEP